ncbi:CBL-interacting serine/threonine-protein kinase 12 [Senna tora]|uniref:non-specific serine/threonine protein kinase n=1 Tax=Senna tora TaxID=362788 RepID=A0A834X8S4_9FABA|nr:CBL-interacting serine/threonine-protein kinase 12 [Senna tora]
MADAFVPFKPKSKDNANLLLGRFEIGKLLGHGTFAKVYSARNIKTDEVVAIKIIDKEKILKGGLVAHIKREISILRRVRHPNIVQLFEVMATKAKIYFVMEYVRGGELFNKVAKGRLKEEIARKYFQQLISAVGFCHARGVYHRDLKPENLLLDDNGDLKVSDFGLSAVSDQIRQDGLFHTFCGTPAYVAPEVLARKGYDGAKVDLWSCGVVLFVLVAGYLPFHDQNVMAMYKKIYRGVFRCPKWFSPDLNRLCTRLLDTNPETRIAIPEIMENKWFKKGFKQIKFYFDDDKLCTNFDDKLDFQNKDEIESMTDYTIAESDSEVESRRRHSTSLPRPASLNAFDIISFSPGFDLSGLFEEKGDQARFVSGAPVSKIISTLEEIAQLVSFTVRRKDCRVSLEGSREGVKGPLTIAAEIFELTPSLMVVEVKKKGGDQAEYEEFCNAELKPGLQKLTMEEYATSSANSSSQALDLPPLESDSEFQRPSLLCFLLRSVGSQKNQTGPVKETLNFGLAGHDFVEVDDVRVPDESHDGDLALDLIDQADAENLLFVDDFNGDALVGGEVSGVVDFGECALAQ